jgi:hypothetical protein
MKLSHHISHYFWYFEHVLFFEMLQLLDRKDQYLR